MLVAGITGFFATTGDEFLPDFGRGFFHDSAACLIDDSGIAAAVEEERLNRDKHTNLFPLRAIKECLDQAGAEPADIDHVAYFWGERDVDAAVGLNILRYPHLPWRSGRDLIADRLRANFRVNLPPERITFVRHHRAHAASALYQSGFRDALVVVMDAMGDAESVSVYRGSLRGMKLLKAHPIASSLGLFYTRATELLGYRQFDEYKVMGIAPYGDPSRYRPLMDSVLALRPGGDYRLDVQHLQSAALSSGFRPRRAHEPFTQQHKDLAAAVQEALERLVLHLLAHWQQETGLSRLCLAGGVAQNSQLNGRILASGPFAEVFVHPASHDAGAAVGAASLVTLSRSGRPQEETAGSLIMHHAYLGPDIEANGSVDEHLAGWEDFLTWEYCPDISSRAAQLLATGAVIAWARGRSEFGPRALGNRSILADPRPADNKDRVNALVKRRESFRPFAPAVTAEAAGDYFILPETRCQLDYMGYVVPVRPDRRHLLGAVTHVDGTARIQTVRQESNKAFWELIMSFGELTGVPVLLNTSFNNNAEPIVQSADDAISSFLTTRLDYLVIGERLISRRNAGISAYLRLAARLAPVAEATAAIGVPGGKPAISYRIYRRGYRDTAREISSEAYDALRRSGGTRALADILRETMGTEEVLHELYGLWQDHLIELLPLKRSAGAAS